MNQHPRTKEEILVDLMNNPENRARLARTIMEPLTASHQETLEGRCRCGGELVKQTFAMGGPYSGHVTCQSCGERESFMSYIGKRAFQVTPMSTPGMRPRSRYDIAKGKKP